MAKKLLFWGITILLVCLFIELAAFTGYCIIDRTLFSYSKAQLVRLEIAGPLEAPGEELAENLKKPDNNRTTKRRISSRKKNFKSEVIHPYIGFVLEYGDPDCPDFGFCDSRIRGMKGAPLIEKNDDDFIVAIFGGSFAHQTPLLSSQGVIEETLRSVPELRDKNILIIPIAHGGYKQPQQLMALNFFLSIGAHFDIVINIDGFNEVALPALDTVYGKKTYPFFPRN